jgi:hypothetical protein
MTDLSPIAEVVLTSDLFDDCLDVESLSPAAEAVLDAYMKGFGWLDSPTKKDGRCIAAALRAAADQVAPEDYDPPRGVSYPEKGAFVDGKCVRNEDIRFALLAIAAELEGNND